MRSASAQGASPAGYRSSRFEPLLKTVSRSFYLSLRFLPQTLREPLGLAYLLARTSDTLADVTEAPLGVRLEALDALVQVLELAHGEGEEVPSLAGDFSKIHCPNLNEAALLQKADALVACFAQMQPALRGEVLAVMRTIAGGQRGDLVRFGYASAAAPQALPRGQDTVAYTYAVAGCVGEFWTRICAIQTPGFARIPVQHLVELGRLFGQGLQLVNILRDLPEDLRMGRCYLPSEELSALGLSVSELFNNPKKVRPVFEHWLGQAEAWLEAGEAYGKGIRGRRLRFSVALPRLLGQETLALLRRYPSLETPHRVRVTRSVVLKCALKASMN